ncbi:hypothetical protein [Massilia sp. H6]|uniref:hypothetical protein n=1 Tax=Massilia sp. H6 TaxID=2970464 RepID=UPI002167F4D1|nr:hypothetical protein [Massilia sp. H6]UVW28111.1 hypothetical protein NRS07_16475 [Massilia sp. H6]
MTERLSPNGGPATADAAVKVWHCVFSRFNPLIGPVSTQALFARALALHQHAFPWLPQALTPEQSRQAFDIFAGTLVGQPADALLAANRALLETYSTELADLIGTRLATQFLRSAFPPDDAP